MQAGSIIDARPPPRRTTAVPYISYIHASAPPQACKFTRHPLVGICSGVFFSFQVVFSWRPTDPSALAGQTDIVMVIWLDHYATSPPLHSQHHCPYSNCLAAYTPFHPFLFRYAISAADLGRLVCSPIGLKNHQRLTIQSTLSTVHSSSTQSKTRQRGGRALFQMSGDGAKNTHTQSSKSPPDDYHQSMGQPKALSFYGSKIQIWP